MALHLPGKIARLIGDFWTVRDLAELIEHELEKRIVARHGLVKLDALLNLLPRWKNELKGASADVAALEGLIARLRHDYAGSDFEAARDSMAAHALKLDLRRIVDTWNLMGAATFGILADDLEAIDAELRRLGGFDYPGAPRPAVDVRWPSVWSSRELLGPNRPRYATIYQGLATAGVVAPVAAASGAQDPLLRAAGLATFLMQLDRLAVVAEPGSAVERLFAEMILNDYFALWELLFTSQVRNVHGAVDDSLLEHWRAGDWAGVACLASLAQAPHPALDGWRRQRNTTAAHLDPDVPVWAGDLQSWPMRLRDLTAEAARVVNRLHACGREDIRSRMLFIRPTHLPDTDRYPVLGLSAQEGRRWADN